MCLGGCECVIMGNKYQYDFLMYYPFISGILLAFFFALKNPPVFPQAAALIFYICEKL